MPAQKRETEKVVEINGRRFRIAKFNALTGSYIAYKILFEALPPVLGMLPEASGLPREVLGATGRTMSRESFEELQRDCLSVVSELQMVGSVETPIPVMMAGGRWGVDGLDQDVGTVLRLTVQALSFNLSSFFDAVPAGAKEGVQEHGLSLLNQLGVSTSTNSPTPP